MNNNTPSILIAAALLAALCAPPLHGQELLHRRGVLVLQSGQVMQGEISLHNGVYTVKVVENGELRFRRKAVRLHRDTMDQAYLAMRDELTPSDVGQRLKLASWCLKNNLPSRTADQLLAVSLLEPGNTQLSYLERRLQSRELAPEPVAVASPPPVTPDNPDTAARDLTASQLTQFSTTIQPVLLNNCATSTCHGGRGDTTLTFIRPSAAGLLAKRHTHRNLARIRPYLQAESSGVKLLNAARTPHAGATAPLSAESSQYQVLADWVNSLAWIRSEIQPQWAPGETTTTDTAGNTPATPQKAAVPGKIIHGDPTSPEAFNQRFHPTQPAADGGQ